MTITLHAMSGSPFSWKIALALEHKQLQYELRWLSADAGDLKRPEFAALNPRRRAPVLTDGNVALYESSAILQYLEDAYSEPTLFPGDLATRALAYRLLAEVDGYFAPAMEELVLEVLFKPDPATRHQERVTHALAALGKELTHFEQELRGDFLAGPLSAVDFALYPALMLCLRIDKRAPELGISARIGPKLSAWCERIQTLPYYERTYPPHWKKG